MLPIGALCNAYRSQMLGSTIFAAIFSPILYLFSVWCSCIQGNFYPIVRIDLPYWRKINFLLGFFQQILEHNVNMGSYIFSLDKSWGIISVNRACFPLLWGYPNKLHILETANIVNCSAPFRSWKSWLVSISSDIFVSLFCTQIIFFLLCWGHINAISRIFSLIHIGRITLLNCVTTLFIGFVSCDKDLRVSVLLKGHTHISHKLAKKTNNKIDQELVREVMSIHDATFADHFARD